MNDAGQLYFGVYPNQVRTVNTSASYRDGEWHHVVASLGPDGMRLYVDGRLEAQRDDTTSGQGYDGYWRVAGDNLGGWPAGPSSSEFEGSLDEVAIYGSALSAERVASHYASGTTGAAPNVAPTATITPPTISGLRADFNGSGTDTDGTVVAYAWAFGDGTTASGASATKVYDHPGTYAVTLTVTDDRGATGSATTSVEVAPAPNQAPAAVIGTPQVTDARAVFDGSGSSDPDGSIVSYAWDLGDGTTSNGATAERTYGASGTYTVRLTVTDDGGATATTTKDVVVIVPAAGLLAQDAFERTAASSWGQADRGGAWTLRGGTNRFSVSGGAGRITLPAGQALTAYADLNDIVAANTRLEAVWSVDKLVESQYVGLVGRRTGTGNDFYAARLRLQADGGVRLNLMLGTASSLGAAQLPLTITPGAKYHTVVQVTGTSSVDIKAKVWKDGDPEPGWQIERTVTPPAALAGAGSPSVFSYGPNVAGGPGIVAFDSVTLTDPTVAR
jgi:PKD repeat protein